MHCSLLMTSVSVAAAEVAAAGAGGAAAREADGAVPRPLGGSWLPAGPHARGWPRAKGRHPYWRLVLAQTVKWMGSIVGSVDIYTLSFMIHNIHMPCITLNKATLQIIFIYSSIQNTSKLVSFPELHKMFDVGGNHCDKWDGKHNKGIYFLPLLRLLILVPQIDPSVPQPVFTITEKAPTRAFTF